MIWVWFTHLIWARSFSIYQQSTRYFRALDQQQSSFSCCRWLSPWTQLYVGRQSRTFRSEPCTLQQSCLSTARWARLSLHHVLNEQGGREQRSWHGYTQSTLLCTLWSGARVHKKYIYTRLDVSCFGGRCTRNAHASTDRVLLGSCQDHRHTVYLQWSYSVHTVVLQWSYSGLTVVLQCTYSVHTVYIQWSYSVLTMVLQCTYSVLTVYIQCTYSVHTIV